MLGVAPRNRKNLGFLPPRPSLNSLKSSSRARKVSESVLCSQSLRCLCEVFECKVKRAAARTLHRSMDQNEHLSRSQTVQRNGWTIFCCGIDIRWIVASPCPYFFFLCTVQFLPRRNDGKNRRDEVRWCAQGIDGGADGGEELICPA